MAISEVAASLPRNEHAPVITSIRAVEMFHLASLMTGFSTPAVSASISKATLEK